MRRFAAVCAVLVTATLNAAPPEQCAGCHPAEAKLHTNTKMAHAMMRAFESAFALNLPERPLQESQDGYAFVYHGEGAELSVSAARQGGHSDGVIRWVLGAGAQGQTPLIETATGTLESRVSYFPALHQYGITVGQEAGSSANPKAALGRSMNTADLRDCLSCHATAISKDLQVTVPGVQCERCHPGAEEHAKGRGTPLNPGKLGAAEQVRFCGGCHRTKPPVDDTQLENVRFQPLRLMKSRCFSSGKLACTTCHPAHQDARRSAAAFYNEKCAACHTSRPAHKDERAHGDCIGCHMPYVQLHPALKFTDHFIQVVKAGDLPAPLLRQRESGSGN